VDIAASLSVDQQVRPFRDALASWDPVHRHIGLPWRYATLTLVRSSVHFDNDDRGGETQCERAERTDARAATGSG
jgi:hypothetical protein